MYQYSVLSCKLPFLKTHVQIDGKLGILGHTCKGSVLNPMNNILKFWNLVRKLSCIVGAVIIILELITGWDWQSADTLSQLNNICTIVLY